MLDLVRFDRRQHETHTTLQGRRRLEHLLLWDNNITLHYWVWLCVRNMPLGKYVDRHPRGVRNVSSNASAICPSLQPGPSTSAVSSIRARRALSRATRGPATSCCRVWRSSSVKRTTSLASLPMARSLSQVPLRSDV